MLTGRQLAAYCVAAYKALWVYWYGTYGNPCSQSLYNSKKKQYPSHYTGDRTSGYMKDIANGRTCADCVGMIKAFFWSGGDISDKPKYASNHCPDVSANGMIKLCKQTGPIASIPDEPGLVVWKDGHIGVYIGDGYTIEMRGFAYDCVKRKVKDGPWVKWGRLPESMIQYTDEPAPEPMPIGWRDLRKGCEGEDVREMQSGLMKLGYPLPKYGADGDFGSETLKAVKTFQTDQGLEPDGVMQADDFAALSRALTQMEQGDGEQETPEPDQPAEPQTDQPQIIREVEITGGSVNVRSAPGTEGTRILGIVYRGNRLPWQGEIRNVDGRDWYLVEFALQNAWVSSKYAKLLDGGGEVNGSADLGVRGDDGDPAGAEPVKRGEKICDISKWQPTVNYDAFIADTALIILRAGVRKDDGKVYIDERFRQHADALEQRGVRFGVYFYSQANTPEKAYEDAAKFYEYAAPYRPLFWAVDLEDKSITPAAIAAFADELRDYVADEKIGAYVANHLYDQYRFDSLRNRFDFIWIPRYGSTKPAHSCDLWQYTSTGSVEGISGNVDLNRITGDGHDLEWFTGGEAHE